MKILTKDLIGPPLDWATCHALGNPNGFCGQMLQRPISYVFRPSTSGSEVIDIMEQEKIGVGHSWDEPLWLASAHDMNAPVYTGPTLRVAVCRCFVASKLGDEVEVPDELVKSPT